MSEPQQAQPDAAVIVGTTETILGLRAAMAGLPDAPDPIGCLLVGHTGAEPRGSVAGVPVLGSADELAEAHEAVGFDLVILTLPADQVAALAKLRSDVAQLGVAERVVPPLQELLSRPPASAGLALLGVSVGGAHTPSAGARIEPAALIGREPTPIDDAGVRAQLSGKRVLITGAGGSIGSELARLCAQVGPSELILMERSENALFEIDRQLQRLAPGLPRRSLLHDVVDERATRRQLERLRPDAVYHAAAHKHVPLMEDHPAHAVENNYFGTLSIAEAAAGCGAERFVLISSDKAVNPSSVMGATKRLAERCVQALAPRWTGTRFSMVRFGNVLGSAGSVVPIWAAQLAEGGPITVTDQRMTRYFMTIPEAASLVLQASVLEQDEGAASLYELDMGEPVGILDLARRFCAMHGFAPFVAGDAPAAGRPPVEIVMTGVRPGEKLHEELAYQAEQVEPTAARGVLAWPGDGEVVDLSQMTSELRPARGSAGTEMDPADVTDRIRRWVPEMAPQSENSGANVNPASEPANGQDTTKSFAEAKDPAPLGATAA